MVGLPYIPQSDRERIGAWQGEAMNVGDLTYVLYKECVRYLKNSSGRYADRAEIIAALECAKLEFYRKHIAPYEDKKIALNGDVTG